MYVGTFKLYTLYVIPSTFSPGKQKSSSKTFPRAGATHFYPIRSEYLHRDTCARCQGFHRWDPVCGTVGGVACCKSAFPAEPGKSVVSIACVCRPEKSKSSKVHIPVRGAGVNKKKNLVFSD